jgi:hypothetical protein
MIRDINLDGGTIRCRMPFFHGKVPGNEIGMLRKRCVKAFYLLRWGSQDGGAVRDYDLQIPS